MNEASSMLDRSKLIKELRSVADKLFIDSMPFDNSARDEWRKIADDPTFIYKIRQAANFPWPVPLWDGRLDETTLIEKIIEPHYVLSVDGSQIYPDRHHALSCFLINIGTVVLPYNVMGKKVQFRSEPTVFAGSDDCDLPFSSSVVNCKRQELEFYAGLELGREIKESCEDVPYILLFDGSLIFWHLSSQDIEIRDRFLHSYLALLAQLYENRIFTAWYISMPKSKELLNLVRLSLCDFDTTKVERYQAVNQVIDTSIVRSFLPTGYRTTIFRNQSSISKLYPEHLKPCFFYSNIGSEIGRVELPAWMAQDSDLVAMVSSLVFDQCVKGGGYPVALAEAHEQAVVKGPDRDFFYHLLQKLGIERNHSLSISFKSLKKRGIGI